ncbi:PEP-CTERM sorting domain-containing protein [Paludisphaera mucosa]|uniref:PEP-CTERM sorting domain-containing protein n=1 Tax=Paludisphaera mucosa TaxID=3030827 RepID=A0ABT6FF01_9BACT|nr:PEP-CTERM sorting domain-containing protein [Paludisphaera mucosa]MDG3006071.1 PEP-CTERM sorting domain-containing protein [Paludisphaera mucosa]
MKTVRSLCLLAAFAAAVIAAPATHAGPVPVDFGTTGTFNGSNDTFYDAGGNNIISFDGLGLKTINLDTTSPTVSTTNFGSFDTTLFNSTAEITFSVSFALTIQQLNPTPSGSDIIVFTGTIAGSLSNGTSSLTLTFDPPLFQTIAGSPDVKYSIISADTGIPGTVAIAPNLSGGATTIQGRVEISAVPEPSTIALAGLAAPMVLMYRRRSLRTV